MALYTLKNVSKSFQGAGGELSVLRNIDLTIEQGESLAIVGASGCGKTSLLHLLGALDTPTKGSILFEGQALESMGHEQKAHIRNKKIGFVFQFHHLLPEFSSLENVAMQALIGGMPKKEALEKAREALDLVELSARIDHKVTNLSGGERQRVAIARAILLRPLVLLADEPTGNLDQNIGKSVTDILLTLNQKHNMTLVVVTHNIEMAKQMGLCLELRSGELL